MKLLRGLLHQLLHVMSMTEIGDSATDKLITNTGHALMRTIPRGIGEPHQLLTLSSSILSSALHLLQVCPARRRST